MMTHNHDLEINPNTAVDNNPVHEAMLFYWGARCPEHEDGCPVCEAWEQYDTLCVAAVRSTWTHRKKYEFDKAKREIK